MHNLFQSKNIPLPYLKRITIQRQLIFAALKELNAHSTAEEVFEYVSQRYPSISKATIYRNLSQMALSGAILNIGNFYGSAHYDHKCHKHCHFVCKSCRQIFDFEEDFSKVLNEITTPDRFDVADCDISFSGLCKKCKTILLDVQHEKK